MLKLDSGSVASTRGPQLVCKRSCRKVDKVEGVSMVWTLLRLQAFVPVTVASKPEMSVLSISERSMLGLSFLSASPSRFRDPKAFCLLLAGLTASRIDFTVLANFFNCARTCRPIISVLKALTLTSSILANSWIKSKAA